VKVIAQPLQTLLPGTEASACGLRWEIVGIIQQGEQSLVRIRGIEGVMLGRQESQSFKIRL
jgi:hypothetical protein